MAGNLARAMSIGGRTAGLQRMASYGWRGASIGTVSAGTSRLVAENAFTIDGGYTIDFSAQFGNGATDGWLGADSALSIALGDGTNSGILNLSESAIMWGSDVLFCWDTSTLADEGKLRIAWHKGNSADNVLSGYYVWLDDMLIGQGLSATQGAGLNGILISASGAGGSITGLTWTDKAYAPTTPGMTSTEHAFYTTQASGSGSTIPNTLLTTSGKDFSNATSIAATGGRILINSDNAARTIRLTSAQGWTAMTNQASSGEVNVQLTGHVVHTIIGAKDAVTHGKLTLELTEGSSIGTGSYNGQTASIAGTYGGGQADSFHVYINGGEVGGDIVGGAVQGSGRIGDVRIVMNGGTVTGNVMGGSKVSGGTVDNACIMVTGGKIEGSIIAGGNAGTIGNTSVSISGGEITGDVLADNATCQSGTGSSITVTGHAARIGGNMAADHVTLRDMTAGSSNEGFAAYTGRITATKLTLDNVQVALKAELAPGITSIEVNYGSRTSAVLGDTFSLDCLLMSDGTSFTAYRQLTEARGITSSQLSSLSMGRLEVGTGVTLNSNLVFSDASVLVLNDTLQLSSQLSLASGMDITLSSALLSQLYSQLSVEIFAGVDALTLDGESLSDGAVFTLDSLHGNLQQGYEYTLAYADGIVTLHIIPEPATATLSLAVLAFLAGRRRRRS